MMFIALFLFLFAAESTPTVNQEGFLATPRRAVHTFLYWQLEGHENPALPALTMTADTSLTLEDRQQLARQLRLVLDAKALIIDYADIPNDPNFTDSLSGQHTYILFSKIPGIFLVKINNNWVFSKPTLERIPELYAQTYSVMIDLLIDNLPQWTHRKWWKFELWQVFALGLFFLGGFVLRKLFEYILEVYVHRWAQKTESKWDDSLLDEAERPASLIVTLGFYLVTYPNLRLNSDLNLLFGILIRVGLSLSIIWLLYRLTNVLGSYLSELTSKTESKLDDQVVPLVKKVLKVIVVIAGILVLLQNFGVNVGSIMAGLGIGGLAFALAAKDTLSNFFGSIMIFLDKPFQIGDRIIVEGTDGIVEEVGFRSTRIRTADNSLVSLPNSAMANAAVNNYGLRRFRRYKTILGVTYSTTPAQIEAFTEGIKSLILQNQFTRKDAFDVYFFDYAESSLNILVNVFFETTDWTVELQERHNLLLNIHQLATKLGIQFAFPTRTLHIETLRKETENPAPEPQQLIDSVKPGSLTYTAPDLKDGTEVINYQQRKP